MAHGEVQKTLGKGFAECYTRQNYLCRVFFGLRRVPWTHGKATDSGSVGMCCNVCSVAVWEMKMGFTASCW